MSAFIDLAKFMAKYKVNICSETEPRSKTVVRFVVRFNDPKLKNSDTHGDRYAVVTEKDMETFGFGTMEYVRRLVESRLKQKHNSQTGDYEWPKSVPEKDRI